jgi:hypothetical protein
MSSEEFWKDDPQLFVSYRTSFINKKKREMEEFDYKCWLQGLYIHDGNGKLVSSLKQFIGNIISKNKNNSKIDSYPLKPYFEDEEKADWIGKHWNQYINECIDIREAYNEEQKNLKALANKKN